MEKAISFLGGFVMGAVFGAASAALLAPQSGTELQMVIRERIDQVIQEGQRAAAERRAELEAQFAQSKQFQRPAPSGNPVA
jgi:gas vesicle protein